MINKNYIIFWSILLWLIVIGTTFYIKRGYGGVSRFPDNQFTYQEWNQKNESNISNQWNAQNPINTAPQITISDDIRQGLLLMREEEKLAKDVYAYFASLYSVPAFTNITASETKHMSSVKTLLDKYNITDPVKDDTIWVFTNPLFTMLYNELTTKGTTSLTEALKIWIQIEELDITDIDKLLSQVPTDSDFALVYNNLRSWSIRHLTSFINNLEKQWETYVSIYLQ